VIKINLIKKRNSAASAASESGLPKVNFDTLRSMGQDSGKTLAPLFFKAGIPIILGLIANFAYDQYVEGVRDVMKKEVGSIEVSKDKINKELLKIKGFESTKTELERTSMIIRAKIDTIEKLIKGRDFTAKALMSLVQSLPKESWLVEVSQTDKAYSLRGGTVDIGMVSDLMSHLGKTIYFKDVTLKSTASDPASKRTNFELTARRE